MSEVVQKELDKNYSKLQKKEIKVQENSEKLLAGYDKKVKALATTLKEDVKKQKEIDKQIKDEQKVQIKAIKDDYKEKTADVTKTVKETNDIYKKEIAKADDQLLKEETKQNGLIEKANNAYNKEKEKLQAKYDKDVEASNKEIDKINSQAKKDLDSLQEKYDAKLEKHNEKVATLTEKRDAKIAKFNEASAKKIAKFNEDITKQREKSDKQIADLDPVFDDKFAEVDGLIEAEKEDHENKVGNINSTLESKVTRRNKFLEKAENENDNKAAKVQRKEIKQLQQNADKEIKTLVVANIAKIKEFDARKKEISKNKLEQIAVIEREFVNFKESNLMQIEMNKATLADDITRAKLDTDLKLHDEDLKFNEFTNGSNKAKAERIEEQELKLQEQKHKQAELLIEFDKVNEINAHKLEQELAERNKEIKIAHITKDSDYNLSEIKRDVELAKLDAKQKVFDKENETNIIVNEEETLIKYHNNDATKLASVKNEFLNVQEETSALMQERARDILEYEELELENRTKIKTKFLEAQTKKLEKDHENLVARIETAFKQENDLYEEEIDKIAKEDQKELDKYKEAKEEEINEIVEEKNELDPQADKRKIKDLSDRIQELRTKLSESIKQKEDAIRVKTGIYQDYREQAQKRRDLALEQAQELLNYETNEISYALELLNQNKEAEIKEAQARYAKTLTNANNYVNLSTNRNALTTEENTNYTNARVEKENSIIANAKASLEEERNSLKSILDSTVQDLDDKKQSVIERIKAESLNEEEILEGVIRDVDSKINQSEDNAQSRMSEEINSNSQNIKEIETKSHTEISRSESELRQQEAKYKTDVESIDKNLDLEKKNFETAQGRVQKVYELELKKGIANVNAKLEADVRKL